MARMRKARRLWNDPRAAESARRVIVPKEAPLFTIEPRQIFVREAPLEVEIGAGRGDFIIGRARANPDRNFLAVERPGTIGRLLAVRCGRAGLENLRVATMDARTLVILMLPDKSVDVFHVYFPDPWPKTRQVKHRLFAPSFAQGLMRTLKPGGVVYVATDVAPWAAEMFEQLEAAGFRRTAGPAPGATLTGFARKYLAQGKRVFSGGFEPAREEVPAALGAPPEKLILRP
jgi:tRNA (guanine-N7-)-methyltransferase